MAGWGATASVDMTVRVAEVGTKSPLRSPPTIAACADGSRLSDGIRSHRRDDGTDEDDAGDDAGDVIADAQAAIDEARRRLAEVPAEIVVTNHVMGLYELAAIHLSASPPNLASAALAIDAVGCLVDGLGDRLGPDAADVARRPRQHPPGVRTDQGRGHSGVERAEPDRSAAATPDGDAAALRRTSRRRQTATGPRTTQRREKRPRGADDAAASDRHALGAQQGGLAAVGRASRGGRRCAPPATTATRSRCVASTRPDRARRAGVVRRRGRHLRSSRPRPAAAMR